MISNWHLLTTPIIIIIKNLFIIIQLHSLRTIIQILLSTITVPSCYISIIKLLISTAMIKVIKECSLFPISLHMYLILPTSKQSKLFLIYDSLVHFQLLQLKPNIKNCPQMHQKVQNSFLLINTNTKIIGLKYMKLFKSLVSKNQKNANSKCINFKLFLLRQKSILLMDQQQLEQYTSQISQALKAISSLTLKKLSIMTTQQGSALLLKSFSDMIDTGQYKSQLSQKIDKVILLNMYNGNMIKREPISEYLNQIKTSIIYSKQKLKIFNSLNFIIINTLQKQYRLLAKINNQQNKYLIQNNKKEQSKQLGQINQEDESQTMYDPPISDSYFVFERDLHWIPSTQGGIQLIQRSQQPIKQPETKNSNKNSISQNSFMSSNYILLQNTTMLHTMQMYNIHASFINGDYFHYHPFLQLISNFIVENTHSSMTLKAVQFYFRYGQTKTKISPQSLADTDLNFCVLYNINTTQPTLWINTKKCFRLNLTTTLFNSAYLLYSDNGKFQVYTESMHKIAPFNKELNKSLYLFEKLQNPIIVYNPHNLKIILTMGQIFSPSNPLTKLLTHHQILYLSQIQPNLSQQNHFNKRFVVKMCQSSNLLVFPDNFPIGKISRQFLLRESHQSCYDQNNSYQKFMDKLTQNWTLIKNIIIFIVFKRFFVTYKHPLKDMIVASLSISFLVYQKQSFIYKTNFKNFEKIFKSKKSLTDFFFVYKQFVSLMVSTQLKGYHSVLIMFIVYVIEQGLKVVHQLGHYIQIDSNKVFLSMIILFIVSYVCQSFLFQHYNYWKMLLIFLIFFLNTNNAYIIGIKLFYLQDSILYGHQNFSQIIQIALYMYLTRTVKDKKRVLIDAIQQVIKILVLFGLAFLIIFYPQTDSFHSVFNFYIKSTIILKFLKMFLYIKGSKWAIQQLKSQ